MATKYLYLATCAAGGGDLTFAHSVIEQLALIGVNVAIILSQQAAADQAENIRLLQDIISAEHTDTNNLDLIGSGHRVRDGIEISEPSQREALGKLLLQLTIQDMFNIIQGPLALFESPNHAFASLYTACDISNLECPRIRLVTLREFGQSSFCNLMNSGNMHIDVSSGLSKEELGIFGLPLPRQLATLPLHLLSAI